MPMHCIQIIHTYSINMMEKVTISELRKEKKPTTYQSINPPNNPLFSPTTFKTPSFSNPLTTSANSTASTFTLLCSPNIFTTSVHFIPLFVFPSLLSKRAINSFLMSSLNLLWPLPVPELINPMSILPGLGSIALVLMASLINLLVSCTSATWTKLENRIRACFGETDERFKLAGCCCYLFLRVWGGASGGGRGRVMQIDAGWYERFACFLGNYWIDMGSCICYVDQQVSKGL